MNEEPTAPLRNTVLLDRLLSSYEDLALLDPASLIKCDDKKEMPPCTFANVSDVLKTQETLFSFASASSASSPLQRRKKAVKWIDEVGHPLVETKKFWQEDETWRCNKNKAAPTPSSPLLEEVRAPVQEQPLKFTDRLPINTSELMLKLGDQGVQLESVFMRFPMAFLTIRCLNISFHKRVFVRASFDGWKSFQDLGGDYLSGSSDSRTDKFYVNLHVPPSCPEVQFAVCYEVGKREYWDNNNNDNYKISVHRAPLPPPVYSGSRVPGHSSLSPKHVPDEASSDPETQSTTSADSSYFSSSSSS